MYIAAEHMETGNFAVAKKWLDRPTTFFRREQWAVLLGAALAHHAEVALRLQNTPEFVIHGTLRYLRAYIFLDSHTWLL